MTLVPELESIRKQMEQINSEASQLCAGLSEAQLAWRRDSTRWSIAENLVHLSVTANVFLPSIDESIADARRRHLFADGPFSLGMAGKFYVWYVKPPVRVRLRAPKPLKPLLQGSASQALAQFLRAQERILQRVEAANGLDLQRATWSSPLATFIRMNLLTIFSVCTGHERRHLWQAQNVRRQLLSASGAANSAS
jgi:hypothetical protein